jgi:peptidoglycan/LPS O-acetylase OafA/YrhL
MNSLVLGQLAGVVLAFAGAIWVAGLIARRGFPLPAEDNRIGRIDGLRGFLCLAVVCHHFLVWMQMTRLGGSWAPPAVNFFQMIGSGAVALFFMTTGLLFYPRIRSGFRANNWPAVFVARVFRIMPMSVISFALITLVIMLHTGNGIDSDFPAAALQWITAADEPPLLGFARSAQVNAYVLWTLKIEWMFYLLALPACALLMDIFRPRLPSWTVPVAIILISIICKKLFPGVGFWKYMPLFATGMLAFEARSRPELVRWLKSRAATWGAVIGLLTAAILFKSPLDLAWPLLAFFFFAVACGNDLGGFLSTPASMVLSECSYSMYLLHGMVLFLLFTEGSAITNLFATPVLPFLLLLAALIVVPLTAAGFLLVERPGMIAGHSLARRLRSLSARKVSLATE